jgi:virginiamycin B lyase
MFSFSKLFNVFCLAALLFSQAASLSARQTAIIEHRIPIDRVNSITAGPDGALWLCADQGPYVVNTILRITTAGAITEYPLPRGMSPYEITAGPDGALWFTTIFISGTGNLIVRMTTTGALTEYETSGAGGITSGPDGALWFTESGKIGRITTAGVITEFALPTGIDPAEITTGPDGALWFTSYDEAARFNKVESITTGGVITERYSAPIVSVNSHDFQGIATGPDGAVWFADFGELKMGRITTTGSVTKYAVPGSPYRVTAGSDGAVWFTLDTPGIGSITSAGVVAAYPLPTVGARAKSITTGSDGAVWFGEYGARQVGQLVFPTANVAITPSTGAPGTVVTLAGSGFTSGETINLYANSTGSSLLGTTVASSDGSFVTSGRWPLAPYGARSVAGVGQTSEKLGVGAFFVLPRIVVEPSSVPPGGTITVQGFGFGDRAYVTLYFDYGPNLGRVQADQKGDLQWRQGTRGYYSRCNAARSPWNCWGGRFYGVGDCNGLFHR